MSKENATCIHLFVKNGTVWEVLKWTPRCVDAVEKFLTPPYFFPRPFPLTPPPSPLLPSPSYPHSPTHSLPVGVIVEYVGSEAAAKDIAMHIAANKPIGMNSKDVPESVIAAERCALKYARTCKYTHVLTLSLVFITGIPHPLNGIFANLCLVRNSTISIPSSWHLMWVTCHLYVVRRTYTWSCVNSQSNLNLLMWRKNANDKIIGTFDSLYRSQEHRWDESRRVR